MTSEDDYEAETIRRALTGEHDAGREALRLCRAGLDHANLSRPLAAYLAERLWLIDQALDEAERLRKIKQSPGSIRSARDAAIAEALCIKRPAKKAINPFPDWEEQYAAFGMLLLKAGMPREEVKSAMSAERKKLEPDRIPRKSNTSQRRDDMEGLDRSNAGRILKKYAELLNLDDDLLMHLAGPLRQIVPTYLPHTRGT